MSRSSHRRAPIRVNHSPERDLSVLSTLNRVDMIAQEGEVDNLSPPWRARRSLSALMTSEIAATRATRQEVKDYANMIVADHKAAGEALKTAMSGSQLSASKHVMLRRMKITSAAWMTSLPSVRARSPNAEGQRLAPEWDHDYIAMQIDMHQDAIDLFEDYAENGDNAALQTLRPVDGAKVERTWLKPSLKSKAWWTTTTSSRQTDSFHPNISGLAVGQRAGRKFICFRTP